MSRRSVLAAVAAGLTTVFVASNGVSATSPTPASGTVWNQNQRVYYRWKEGNEPPAWARSAVNAAAGDSNSSRGSKAAILAQYDGGSSWVGYTADIPSTYAIGYTVTYAPNYFTLRLRPQGYPLDWGTLKWCQYYSDPPTGCYDAEMITLHEMGHAQTLDHPDDASVTNWTDTIMHWAPKTKAKAGWNQHEFGICDVARLQIRYEALTASTPYSTCLDLATDLSLSVSASSVTAGSTITISSRLKVSDSVSWPLLAGDPAAGRQVTLQRRPSGGSWTNVGGMTSIGDGQYQKSFSVSNSFDYRAVFSPSSEGLRGVTSIVLHVTVTSSGPCSNSTKIYVC
jgi:hypothetical protein